MSEIESPLDLVDRVERLEAERDGYKAIIERALRTLSADPESNIDWANVEALLLSWINGWMDKADWAIERVGVLETIVRPIAEKEILLGQTFPGCYGYVTKNMILAARDALGDNAD